MIKQRRFKKKKTLVNFADGILILRFQANPLRLLSDDFLWVKKVFNFLASFVSRSMAEMKKHEEWERWQAQKKSWNYDDLIRKVRNNEGFLMRNFHRLGLLSSSPVPTLPNNNRQLTEFVVFLLRASFASYIIHNLGGSAGQEEQRKT